LHYRIWNCKKETNLRIGSGRLQIQVFCLNDKIYQKFQWGVFFGTVGPNFVFGLKRTGSVLKNGLGF
jgi:hypothetical protein